MENITIFHLKIIVFTAVKKSQYIITEACYPYVTSIGLSDKLFEIALMKWPKVQDPLMLNIVFILVNSKVFIK